MKTNFHKKTFALKLALKRKSNFYCQLELNNNYLYTLGHKKKLICLFVCLFVCLFSSKMRANKCFFNPFAQLVFVVSRQ